MPIFYNDSGSFNLLQVTGSQSISGSASNILNIRGSGSNILQVSGSAGGGIFTIGDYNPSTALLMQLVSSSVNVFTVTNTSAIVTGSIQYTNLLSIGTLGFVPLGALAQFQSANSSYNQVLIQNSNAGSAASSDIIVNNNLSTDTTYYGDFGINSSTFAGAGSLNLPNATYLYSSTGELVLGTATQNGIHFVVNSSANDILLLTGSNAIITGSLNVSQGITGSLLGTSSYAVQAATASYVNTLNQTVSISGSLVVTGSITGSLLGTSSYAVQAATASYVLNAVSSSFAQTASYIRGTIIASSSIPTLLTGSGLGTARASGSIVGSNNGGILTLQAGTGTTANAGLAKVTYTTAFPNGSSVVLFPLNASGSNTPTGSIFASGSTANFVLSSSVLALQASVTSSWNYIVMGY